MLSSSISVIMIPVFWRPMVHYSQYNITYAFAIQFIKGFVKLNNHAKES